ncbi:hypothetical protein [Escherichia coli]
MFHVDNSTGVPVMPQPSPVTSETELFFTEGGNGVPPTYPGPDWFNVIQSELLNILKAAGIDPDKMDNTQILVALKKLFLSRSNPFGDIKADGAAAIAAALTNLRLYDIINPTTNGQTVVYDPVKKNCLVIRENGQWGAEVVESGEVIPLPMSRGGTGGRDKAEALENLGLGDGTGRLVKCQVFKTSGTYIPTPGTTFCIVEMVGGGGAGGGCLVGTNSNAACGGGGMSGEYVKARVDTPVATIITIGAGGIGVSAAVGQHGGATSFGTGYAALGGLGGNILSEGASPGIVGPYGSYFAPGFTGANIYGSGCGYSSPGIRISGSLAIGGPGGSSVLGAGAGAQAIVGEGINANGPGGGGSGACVYGGATQQRAGGAGMAGIVIVWEYA